MKTVKGVSILKKSAIGKIKFYEGSASASGAGEFKGADAELAAFRKAAEKAVAEHEALYEKALESAGEENAAIFEVHAMMTQDEGLTERIEALIIENKLNAYASVTKACDEQKKILENTDDEYMRERAQDMDAVKASLLNALGGMGEEFPVLKEPSIIAADNLLPAALIKADRKFLAGFVTAGGSANSHTAILARGMGIAGIVGCGEIDEEWDGKTAIIDGGAACVYVEPREELVSKFQSELASNQTESPTGTAKSTRIKILANMNTPEELDAVLECGADGVGLFRTEFLYIGAEKEPSEDEQFLCYKKILEALSPKRVTMRTCDIGADKDVPYLKLKQTANPALGLRGVRVSLKDRDFFKRQLRALLRASAYGNLGLMFPMITDVRELRACKELLLECENELKIRGEKFRKYSVGVMIETPAAALIADELAKGCDFFSIGTNDLTQYTLAIDREEQEACPFYDAHHAAVMKLIKMTADAAAGNAIPVSICGELAADTSLTGAFIDMGIDALSVSPFSVLDLK